MEVSYLDRSLVLNSNKVSSYILSNLQRLSVLISDSVPTYQPNHLRTLEHHQLDRTLHKALYRRFSGVLKTSSVNMTLFKISILN